MFGDKVCRWEGLRTWNLERKFNEIKSMKGSRKVL